MCGRYIPNTEQEIMEIREILSEISLRVSSSDFDNVAAKEEIFPTDSAPVITFNNDIVHLNNAKWGYEKWDNKGVIINARSETAATSKMFGSCLKNGRCIIPARVYFEWQKTIDNKKIKYSFLNQCSNKIFMAGLMRDYMDKKEFVVLTKNANKNLQFIHDRMPLILKENQLGLWLKGELDIDEILKTEFEGIVYKKAV